MTKMKIFETKCFSHHIGTAGSRRIGGTTLTEMMVAIAVTVVMMAVAGVVFKNAIDASGAATASGEMMATARGIIQQLERDFSGLRPDMPMAIIFEDDGTYRHDRIVFFADGDFQVPYSGGLSGNLARIFYGEMIGEDAGYMGLARRFKIMTADSSAPDLDNAPSPSGTNVFWDGYSPEAYDYALFERVSAADWKNFASSVWTSSPPSPNFPDNFIWHYFNERYDSYEATVSFIRRPRAKSLIGDELQRLYMAGYIGEFKIEIPVGSGPGYGTGNAWSAPVYDYNFASLLSRSRAFYWNVDDMDPLTTGPVPIYRVAGNTNNYTEWYGINDVVEGLPIKWPEALKFTFTLYERNVKYYPDGQTFSYIVKLKQP